MIDELTFEWPEGTRGAVSLTYDDALPCHHEVVGPVLDARGLRATFYVNILKVGTTISGLTLNPEAWREMAAKGHELGNHSIFHPCEGPRKWVPDYYDLRNYTPRKWRDEMCAANLTLSLLDGKTERSFGNTCANTELGDGETRESLEPLIEELFVAGRGGSISQIVEVETVNYNALGHFVGDGKDFATLRLEIDQAMDAGGWIIYMIHGVGEDTHGPEYIDIEEHQRLVDYLGEMQDSIWTAPVAEVARYLKSCDREYVT